MAKRMKKGEKLDLILSELSKLKIEVAKLSKQHSALFTERARQKSRTTPKRPSAKTAKKPSKPIAEPTKANKASKARKVPVLVEADSPTPVSKASS